MHSPRDIYKISILQTEQGMFKNIYGYAYVHIKTTNQKRWIKEETNKEKHEFGQRKGKGEMI